MITDEELSALIAEAGEMIPEPSRADAILAAALAERETTTVSNPIEKARRHPRGLIVGALGTAAALVVVIALVVSSSTTPGPTSAAGPLPTTELGVNASRSAIESLPPADEKTAGGTSAVNTSTTSSQKIITTGTLSLIVEKSALSHVVAELQTIATSLGGYVSTSNVALAGTSRGGTVVLGVPAATFQKAVSDAESLGTIKHLSTTATDVTGQVADLGAQVNALEAARTQLEALFARAGSISALLSVQNEITSVQSQIQQLQAQQRVLANQISFSSLTIALALPNAPHVTAPGGFSKAWHQAISRFVSGLSTLLSDSGIVLFTILLIVAIGLLVLFGGRFVWSFVRRRLL